MAQLLVSKGYDVFGMVRGQNNPKIGMVQDETPELELVEGDLQDLSSLIAVVEAVQPDEVYNLGAISFVALSFRQPELTADITGLGVLRMLEAIRVVGGAGADNQVRFYQASSSEMFGKVRETPQTEATPFHPRSPYGAAKVFGHFTTVNYREAYGLFACSGICFNHESPRRGLEFVTRKVSNGVARIKLGLQDGAGAGQPRRRPGLGLRRRLLRGHVAHAPAGRARRLRHRHRRDPHHPRPARPPPSPPPASTTGSTWSPATPASPARPRSTSSPATPPRPTGSSAGSRGSTSTSWSP